MANAYRLVAVVQYEADVVLKVRTPHRWNSGRQSGVHDGVELLVDLNEPRDRCGVACRLFGH
ncbi:MAG: hypothetical protein ABSF86_06040 [Steroidobacteraceae bacterium]|jgi:hypothetical protein